MKKIGISTNVIKVVHLKAMKRQRYSHIRHIKTLSNTYFDVQI